MAVVGFGAGGQPGHRAPGRRDARVLYGKNRWTTSPASRLHPRSGAITLRPADARPSMDRWDAVAEVQRAVDGLKRHAPRRGRGGGHALCAAERRGGGVVKRVKAFWNSIWKNDRRLVALCYAVFLAGSMLSLYGVAEDAWRARGNVAQTEISGAGRHICSDGPGTGGPIYTPHQCGPARLRAGPCRHHPRACPYVRRVTVR